MDLKEARYILAIADHKSISRAAKALFISQPSLSKYLKNLEQQLDTRLFDRLGNCYTPTYPGERYLSYARQIVSAGLGWEQEFNDIMHRDHGRLNIAIPIMLSNVILGPTLVEFHRRYPHVNINMMEEVNFVAEHTLDDPTVDLTFYNVWEFPTSLDYQILGQEEMVLVLPAHHPLLRNTIKKEGFRYPWVDLAHLEKEAFILLYPDQNTGGMALSLFAQYQMEPRILMHTRNSEMSICLAMNGMGAAFAPERYYHYLKHRENCPSVCLSVGKTPFITTLIGAYRKNRYLPHYAREYMEMIADYCAIHPQTTGHHTSCSASRSFQQPLGFSPTISPPDPR